MSWLTWPSFLKIGADTRLYKSGVHPHDTSGDVIPHYACQPIGRAAYEAGLDGVDCRSAAAGSYRELAWFPRHRTPSEASRLAFDKWW